MELILAAEHPFMMELLHKADQGLRTKIQGTWSDSSLRKHEKQSQKSSDFLGLHSMICVNDLLYDIMSDWIVQTVFS